MKRFVPDMYVKSILDINYSKLKEKGIKVLLFDFDNTIIAHKVYTLDKKYIELLKELRKDFKIYIISNSFNSKKLSTLCGKLDLPYLGKSLKPLSFGFRRLKLEEKREEIAMIGDQLITDVYGSKKMRYFSILVDPISRKNEIIFTRINRKLEEFVMKGNNLKRGEYYG